jgi:uncharacterized protein (TIGR02611 family)
MHHLKQTWRKTPRSARRTIVFIVGVCCIVAGICMLVLPGPGWATIFLGLAILASEFERAERLRAGILQRFRKAIGKSVRSSKR